VTIAEIDAALQRYATGLDAKINLLHQVRAHAERAEQELGNGGLPSSLVPFVDARNRLIDALLELDSQLVPLRNEIRAHRALAESRPGFPATSTLHSVADVLIREILAADGRTVDALRVAADSRRQAAQALEAGSQTLAAYRRILAPPPTHANLFEEKA
jgi:hypothetical protein